MVKFNWIESFVFCDPKSDKDVIYWMVIDKMKPLNNTLTEEEMWFRLTYWRYRAEENLKFNSGKKIGEPTYRRWVNAGQTSISNSINTFEEFFVQAIKEKDWIRPLFKNIMKRCTEELK
jgi:hypothetical protein